MGPQQLDACAASPHAPPMTLPYFARARASQARANVGVPAPGTPEALGQLVKAGSDFREPLVRGSGWVPQ